MATTKTRAKTSKARGAKKRSGAKKAGRVTLAVLAERISELSEHVSTLAKLLIERSEPRKAHRSEKKGARTASAAKALVRPKKANGTFANELLAAVGAVDRRGRHGGLVPIPDVRAQFVAKGWSRERFDEELLQAERDFVVDLKTADDPARLASPELAIREAGRGHLQFVVLR